MILEAVGQPFDDGRYEPGVCNIGPAEIARRRRAGHVGVVATIALFAFLVVIGAPDWTRALVALPAALAASGYLQAALRFCAAFGMGGVFNFGNRDAMQKIEDEEARARDRARALRIVAAAAVIGLATGAVAVVLPL